MALRYKEEFEKPVEYIPIERFKELLDEIKF